MSILELTVFFVIFPVLAFCYIYQALRSWNTSSRVVMSASLIASGTFFLLALLGESPVIWGVLSVAALGVFLLECLLTPLLTGEILFEDLMEVWKKWRKNLR